MTTASQAYQAVRSRIETGAIGVPLRWQNEEEDSNGQVLLPDTPTPFAYTEFLAEGGTLASFGGGAGNNRYRHLARVESYVFVPKGAGLKVATDLAEVIAARLRSYRDTDISCFEATVHPGGDGALIKPPGLTSEVGNYFWAVAEIALFYDLIG